MVCKALSMTTHFKKLTLFLQPCEVIPISEQRRGHGQRVEKVLLRGTTHIESYGIRKRPMEGVGRNVAAIS